MPAYIARTFWSDFQALPPVQRRVIGGAILALGLAALAGVSLLGYLWHVSVDFPTAPFSQPSRLYSRSTHLAAGTAYDPEDLAAELAEQGYRETTAGGPLSPGSFRRETPGAHDARDADKAKAKADNKDQDKQDKDKTKDRAKDKPKNEPADRNRGDVVAVNLRPFRTPAGPGGGVPVEVSFDGSRVRQVRIAGRPVAGVDLEPALLASYYGPELEERHPVALADLPEPVVQAVLAAEDDGFYTHPGVSLAGTARAAWRDLRGGELKEGGSTITQQLVKNLYLSPERTLGRKVREAVLAFVIEAHHGKRAILEAYLNEIYWGRSGLANLVGLGAAARAYFGKDAAELSLGEAATLAGMIRAPADYSPVEHPEAARQRRDQVLRRMRKLGWGDRRQVEMALAEPLATDPQPVVVRRAAPYFADTVAEEAERRFGAGELADAGYQLYSTLSWRDQRRAEAAVAAQLARLEAGPQRKRHRSGPLQAALISVDPRDGAILAWVGGRDYAVSQFDRVAQGRRQAGSAFKPVVYAAVFAEGLATPATRLADSPIVVRFGTTSWQPQNNDRSFRGMVTVRTALEQSLNVPTVRLALQSGLSRVVALARALGIEGDLEPMPSLALGSFGATPRELATVYATLAGGGLRPMVHGLETVLDKGSRPLNDTAPPAPQRVLDAQAAYLVTSILQGALDHGTGQGARAQGVRDELAGKTGTTTGRRDSWFAGYSPRRATVVWVGYDDNAPTRLSGASAALPLWSAFTRAVRPAGGFLPFTPPAGIVTAAIDPATGELATDACPQARTEVFPEWRAPTVPCTLHAGTPWMQAQLGETDPLAIDGTADSLAAAAGGGELVDVETVGGPAEPGAAEGTIVIRRSRLEPVEPLEYRGQREPLAPLDPAVVAPPDAPVAPATLESIPESSGWEDSEDWSPEPPPPPPEGAAPGW